MEPRELPEPPQPAVRRLHTQAAHGPLQQAERADHVLWREHGRHPQVGRIDGVVIVGTKRGGV